MTPRARAALGGAAAATVWGLLEPVDMRLFRSRYSDIALLGKLVTRGRWWRPVGFAMHAANGALFGLLYDATRRRLDADPRAVALGLALVENTVLYPLGVLVDRHHPARGAVDLPRLATPRVFAQETFRHAVFGLLVARFAS